MSKDISELLGDLFTRQRPEPTNRNKKIQKVLLVLDTVTVSSSDSVTTTQKTPPFQFGTSANTGVVGASQCR